MNESPLRNATITIEALVAATVGVFALAASVVGVLHWLDNRIDDRVDRAVSEIQRDIDYMNRRIDRIRRDFVSPYHE